MSFTTLGLLLGFAAAAQIPPIVPATARETREEMERLAGQLKFFDVASVMRVNPVNEFRLPLETFEDYQRQVRRLIDPRHEAASLLELLRHDDPRIRTLALGALFAKDDPKVLPHFVPFANDQAETFPYPFLGAPAFEPPSFPKQTVARVVRHLLVSYMRTTDVREVDGDWNWAEEFERYWAVRKDRRFCAGWFDVELTRAGWVTAQPTEERLQFIRQIRARIDRLPPRDRAMTLLWLHEAGKDNNRRGAHLVSEEELVEILHKLDPADLRGVLGRKYPTDDPDLPSHYGAMSSLILKHARVLLRTEDATFLLDCDRQQLDRIRQREGKYAEYDSPRWLIAAAELQPRRAAERLRPAFDRFAGSFHQWDRSRVAAALWRIAGTTELQFLLDWYFKEPSTPSAHPSTQTAFLREAVGKATNEDRKLVAAILRDQRFTTLDLDATRGLVIAVNAWVEKPLATDLYRNMPDQGKVLQEWRTLLLASLPQWAP